MKKQKYILLIDRKYPLTQEQVSLKDRLIEKQGNNLTIRNVKKYKYSYQREKFIIEKFSDKKIIILNLLHIANTYNQIVTKAKDVSITYFSQKSDNFSFIDYEKSKNIGTLEFDSLLNRNKYQEHSQEINYFLKSERIKFALQDKRNEGKTIGRKQGAKNKQSDYYPYREKIRYRLEKGWTKQQIIDDINFGSISGLTYFVKHTFKKKYYK